MDKRGIEVEWDYLLCLDLLSFVNSVHHGYFYHCPARAVFDVVVLDVWMLFYVY